MTELSSMIQWNQSTALRRSDTSYRKLQLLQTQEAEMNQIPLVLFYPSLSFSTLSIASTNRNFHDCPCLEDDSSLFTDWMDLQIFDDITYLDCYQDSPSSAATSAANYPTHLAYNTLFLGGTPLSFDNTSMLGDLFPIIIYSGTSLSILPQKSDFVGPHQNVDL